VISSWRLYVEMTDESFVYIDITNNIQLVHCGRWMLNANKYKSNISSKLVNNMSPILSHRTEVRFVTRPKTKIYSTTSTTAHGHCGSLVCGGSLLKMITMNY